VSIEATQRARQGHAPIVRLCLRTGGDGAPNKGAENGAIPSDSAPPGCFDGMEMGVRPHSVYEATYHEDVPAVYTQLSSMPACLRHAVHKASVGHTQTRDRVPAEHFSGDVIPLLPEIPERTRTAVLLKELDCGLAHFL
jgi:hypothetical protein